MLGGRIAILGMGVSAAGSVFDRGQEDLLVEAGGAAMAAAGIEASQVGASWYGCTTVTSPGQLNFSLKLDYTSTTEVDNSSATGADILRNAYIAVAGGAAEYGLAIAVDKPEDAGWAINVDDDRLYIGPSAVGDMQMLGDLRPDVHAGFFLTRYQQAYGIDAQRMRGALDRVVLKNRRNGVPNEYAALRSAVSSQEVAAAPRSIGPMTRLDCSAPLDGAAAAIICTVETARRSGRPFAIVDGVGAATGRPISRLVGGLELTGMRETARAARAAYEMAGIVDPSTEIDHVQVFDLTSFSELLAYEDLGLAPAGKAVEYAEEGVFEREGRLPCNTDGGLLSNGFQLSASGLRQTYEAFLQVTGQAGARQLPGVRRSLVHTVGGRIGSFGVVVQILSRGSE